MMEMIVFAVRMMMVDIEVMKLSGKNTREILVSESHEEVAMIIDHLFKRQDSEEYKTSRALYDICVSCNPESDIKILRKIVSFVTYNVVELHKDKWDELGDCILSLASSKEPVKAFHVFIDLPPVYKNQCHFVLASMNEIEGVVGTETKEIVRNAKMLITNHMMILRMVEKSLNELRDYIASNDRFYKRACGKRNGSWSCEERFQRCGNNWNDTVLANTNSLLWRLYAIKGNVIVERGVKQVEKELPENERGGTFTTWIVRKDEEAAAREEQIKREDARKRDAESRLEVLRNVRGLAPLTGGREGVLEKRNDENDSVRGEGDDGGCGGYEAKKKKMSGKKSLKELKRERVEKERERALFMKQSQRAGGFSRR
ncbi:putative non-reducing end alpha-L-arabinofuranosidase [Arabidopsis thaliana]